MTENHPEDCYCEYHRILRRVQYLRNKARETGEYQFIDDPFPNQPNKYFCDTCQLYHPTGYSHNKKPKNTHPGQYRRVHDQALDTINWQYKPWPDHDWVTYHTVAREALHRQKNNKLWVFQHIRTADQILQGKRFYKIERVDTPT